MPTTLGATASGGFLPFASSAPGIGDLPGAGDLLAAVLRANTRPEDYGASGRLPEADTLSPELIAALAGPANAATGAGPLATVPPGPLGIPGVMLDAYLRAEQALAATNPNCGVTWPVLAAIGRIESGHANGGAVDVNGNTLRAILGPRLSGGPGMAVIRDTDGGRLDGDSTWDRAVGPMQFIPGTWARYALDGNGDGVASPHNVYDATRAAASYLCSTGENLRDPGALTRAIFRYNRSDTYVSNVLTWAAAYAAGVTPLPSSPGSGELPVDQPPVGTPPVGTPPTEPPTSTPTTTPTTPPTTPTTPTCEPTTIPPTSTSPSETTTSPTSPVCPPTSTTPPSSTDPTTTPPPSSGNPPDSSTNTTTADATTPDTTTSETSESSESSSAPAASEVQTSTPMPTA